MLRHRTNMQSLLTIVQVRLACFHSLSLSLSLLVKLLSVQTPSIMLRPMGCQESSVC